MSEEGNEGSLMTAETGKPLEGRGVGPTSINVIDEQTSIGEVPLAELQEEVQEQNKVIEQVQEESRISKKKQKRRITSYLSNISKLVEKHGIQINKMTIMIQSLHKQKQFKSMEAVREGQSQLQYVKQIKSQISQLQKQVTRIQDDIQRIGTDSVTGTRARIKTKSRKGASSTGIKPRPEKTKSLKSNKVKRIRRISSR